MLHSENGSPNPLCYHQNLILFDLVMALDDASTRVASFPYAGSGWETRAPVPPACFRLPRVYLPLSQKHLEKELLDREII